MGLWIFNIGGTPISNLAQYDDADLGGSDPFISAAVSPGAEYSDESSIANWDSYGEEAILASNGQSLDFCQVRAEIDALVVAAGGYGFLSAAEKDIAVKWFVVPSEDYFADYTVAEVTQLGKDFRDNIVECNIARMHRCLAHMKYHLKDADFVEVMNEIQSDNLVDSYIRSNMISVALSGGADGWIVDYLESTVGTIYAGVGLSSKPYVLNVGNLVDLVDDSVNVLVDGIYPP